MTDALETYLARFEAPDRPHQVYLALRQLRDRSAAALIVLAELAWESRDKGYWTLVKRDDGSAFEDEEQFFEEVLGVEAWRTAAKRIALGRALAALPDPERPDDRQRLQRIGFGKSVILVPILEKYPAERHMRLLWYDRAEAWGGDALQQAVSHHVGAKPRGTPGEEDQDEKIRAWLLNKMPSIETRAALERFFEVGAKVVDTTSAIGILIAAVQECLAEWEPRLGMPREAKEEDPHEGVRRTGAGKAGNHPPPETPGAAGARDRRNRKSSGGPPPGEGQPDAGGRKPPRRPRRGAD